MSGRHPDTPRAPAPARGVYGYARFFCLKCVHERHGLSQLAWLSSRSLSVLGLSRPHSSQSCVGYGLPMHALGLSRELEAQRAVLVPLHWPQRYAPHPSSGSCAAILLEAAPVDPLGGATAGARARLDELSIVLGPRPRPKQQAQAAPLLLSPLPPCERACVGSACRRPFWTARLHARHAHSSGFAR